MRVTRVRLSVAVLTFLLGVVLAYFADGVVTPVFSEEVEYYDHCWH